MDFASIILTIAGLTLFEIVSSVDNAIINAQVLSTMGAKARAWFLFWGLLFAVVVVRGLLPWLIVFVSSPALGPLGALTATFSNDPAVHEIIERSAPILMIGGGIFLVFLFLHWLFLEDKDYGLPTERFFHEQGVWFFAIVSVVLATVVWAALKIDPFMAFGAVVGSSAFFIVHGFKENAEAQEKKLIGGHLSDLSKIFYLEIIDATFSIDGVLGAFAFTLSVPLILLGNGIGAVVLRQVTMGNIERIKKYVFLKNGAMYSIFVLGLVMLASAFGVHVPAWLSPLATFGIVGYFFLQSRNHCPAAA